MSVDTAKSTICQKLIYKCTIPEYHFSFLRFSLKEQFVRYGQSRRKSVKKHVSPVFRLNLGRSQRLRSVQDWWCPAVFTLRPFGPNQLLD